MQQEQQQQQATHIQNQMNDFVNMILDRSANLNFNSLKNDAKVQGDTYEIYGNLAYLLGLGFTNHDWNENSISYIIERLKKFNISEEILKNFFDIISDTDLNLFHEGKEEMSNMINLEAEPYFTLKNKIIQIIKSSLIPVNITPTISSRFIENPNEKLTFHDLIIFNNSFYEDFIVDSKTAKAFISLTSSIEYKTTLKSASLNFDMQKFALIYMENIINLKDFLSIDKNFSDAMKFVKLLNKESKPDILGMLNEIYPLSENKEIKEVTEDNSITSELPENKEIKLEDEKILSNPETELKAFFDEFENYLATEGIELDYKNNLDDLKTLFENLLKSENELLQSFYIYLKQIRKNQEIFETAVKENSLTQTNKDLIASKINIENILNFKQDDINKYLTKTIQDYQAEYTTFINKYSSEISNKDILLLDLINELVLMLYVQDANDKAILFSQIDKNSIFTYKHLHQMLLSIENQFMQGNNIIMYNNIFKKLKNEYSDIYEMFMNSQKIDNLTLQIKLTYAFKNII